MPEVVVVEGYDMMVEMVVGAGMAMVVVVDMAAMVGWWIWR
jgi:hypothetical protein